VRTTLRDFSLVPDGEGADTSVEELAQHRTLGYAN
jgi:hypothetical protein